MPSVIILELVCLILALLFVPFGEDDAKGSPMDVLMFKDEVHADELCNSSLSEMTL